MGNSVKSRLHIKKKEDRPVRGDHEAAASQSVITPGHTEIDQAIMSGPNRTRPPDTVLPDSSNAHPPTRGVPSSRAETAQTTTTTTARSRT
jgi:hypothetical protein